MSVVVNWDSAGIATRTDVEVSVRYIPIVELLYVSAFVLLLLENALQTRIASQFAYLDEAICLAFCASAIAVSGGYGANRRHVLTDHQCWMICAAIALSVLGLLGNIIEGIQPSTFAVAVDFLTCNKFIVAYISISLLLGDGQQGRVYRYCLAAGKLFLAFAAIFALINQFVGIGMNYESRFGIKAFLFVFGHPSNYAAAVVGILSLCLVDIEKNKGSIFIAMVLLVVSMRFKAIAFVGVVLLCVFLFNRSKRLSIGFLITAGIAAIVLASSQLDVYLSQETARGVLMAKSFEVANDTFPVGSGFATYGSEATKNAYPNLYYDLGFQNIYGLSADNPKYLSDMFYSTIIAQFGWIGLFAFMFMLVHFFMDVAQVARDREIFFWAVMAIPIYFIIASTTEPSFFSSYSVYLALCLVLICTSGAKQKDSSPKSLETVRYLGHEQQAHSVRELKL